MIINSAIKYYLGRLESKSEAFTKISSLTRKPWVRISMAEPFQKLIFQDDGKVLISEEGAVKEARFKILPGTKSMIIEIGGSERLVSEVFADENLMILHSNTTEMKYVVYVNEVGIPDLNYNKYLYQLHKKRIGGISLKLNNGFTLLYSKSLKLISSSDVNLGFESFSHECTSSNKLDVIVWSNLQKNC